MKKCTSCGKEFQDQAFFCDVCGNRLEQSTDPVVTVAAPATKPEKNGYQAANAAPAPGYKGDFTTAPTGINIISIIGFVLSFLCIGFVWIPELTIIIFPLAIIALVLCTIVKALKYNIIFAKIGFIVGLVVTIIAAIVFGIYFYEMIM